MIKAGPPGMSYKLGAPVIVFSLSILYFVKACMPCIQHLLHPGGCVNAFFFHLAQGLFNTQYIPAFEGAYLPAEACFQRIIYLIEFICDLRYAVGDIGKQQVMEQPVELTCLVLAP